MNPGIKALLVTFGTLAFFLLPVIGPGAGAAGNFLVQTVLGVDDESAEAARKIPQYKGTTLEQAEQCCSAKCDLDWNYFQDRCELPTRMASACYSACGAVEKPEVPNVIKLPGRDDGE